jgi:hypothetical protein
VPLPETIPVRFTEEEADFVSIRPVKKQTFRLRELVDMVLCVTGRDLSRVQQILRTGTIVFHFYRYWWQGIEADLAELAALLATFPEDDPSRAFQPESCTVIILESSAAGRQPVEIERAAAQRKSLFSSRNLWDSLLATARASAADITYSGYSFERRADLYRMELSAEQATTLQHDVTRLAPRSLRSALEALGAPARAVFICPRVL